MWFRLAYRGELPASGQTQRSAAKLRKRTELLQQIRRHFHPQLRELWEQEPVKSHKKYIDPNYKPNDCLVLENVGGFTYAPLITQRLKTYAELDVLMLRPSPPGRLIEHGGDLDNRIKTLLDALRMPRSQNEIPEGDQPGKDENPFFCLLQDDALVTRLIVDADRLLDSKNEKEVMLVVKVIVRAEQLTFANMGLVT